jgi:O-antigen/teichoic acid export membrane protein
MEIGRKEVAWNFGATFMRVASGLLVLPLALRVLPNYEIGVYYLFIDLAALTAVLDFGFTNSFTRNVTYVFSGTNNLLSKGYVPADSENQEINYGLLHSVIRAMKRYYLALTCVFIIIFVALSPFYFTKTLETYPQNVDTTHVWVSWWLVGLLTAYQLYTFYYSSLLMARGYVKQNQQIIVLGQAVRIVVCIVCLLCGFGLISMVIGQAVCDLLSRNLMHYVFYDKELKIKLFAPENKIIKISQTMKIMTPNAIKMGVVSVSSFAVNKLSTFVAPIYLSLATVGSFGLTKQMMTIISSLGIVWFTAFYPKITERRLKNENHHLKRMYIKGNLLLIVTYIVCGLGLIFVGPTLLKFFNSKTDLLPTCFIFIFLIISFLGSHQGLAVQILLTKNEVPFFRASIIEGISTVVLLYVFLKFTSLGVFSLILAPGISQIVYQNWKWVYEVWKELKIRPIDYFIVFKNVVLSLCKNK